MKSTMQLFSQLASVVARVLERSLGQARLDKNFHCEKQRNATTRTMNTILCTSERFIHFVAQKAILEEQITTLVGGEEEDELRDDIHTQILDIDGEIISEYNKWAHENAHLLPQDEVFLPKKLDEIHFFRFGKIDRVEEGKREKYDMTDYSIELDSPAGVQECYNEIPDDVRLSAADLLAWGEKNTNQTQLPTVDDLKAWLGGKLVLLKTQLLCRTLATAYIMHFGDRFVINGQVALQQKEE